MNKSNQSCLPHSLEAAIALWEQRLNEFTALLSDDIPLLKNTGWSVEKRRVFVCEPDAISIIFPPIFTVEYSIIFILLGIAWYYIKDKRINCITFAALALLCFFVPDSIFYTLPLRCFSPLYFNISDLFIDGQWCMCLALPFMLLYDGEKGHSMKYFFYIYYPIHVYVLIIISQLRSASF